MTKLRQNGAQAPCQAFGLGGCLSSVLRIIEVKGMVGTEPTTIRYELKGNVAPLTSLPAPLGAELLARGDIAETGVMPPEACVPPKQVLQPLAESGFVEIVVTVEPDLARAAA